jgi:hypothetical protein
VQRGLLFIFVLFVIVRAANGDGDPLHPRNRHEELGLVIYIQRDQEPADQIIPPDNRRCFHDLLFRRNFLSCDFILCAFLVELELGRKSFLERVEDGGGYVDVPGGSVCEGQCGGLERRKLFPACLVGLRSVCVIERRWSRDMSDNSQLFVRQASFTCDVFVVNPFERCVVARCYSEDLQFLPQLSFSSTNAPPQNETTSKKRRPGTHHQLPQIIPQTRPRPQTAYERVPPIGHVRSVEQHPIERGETACASSCADPVGHGVGGWGWVAVRDPGHP